MRDAIRAVRVMHRVPDTVGCQLCSSRPRVDWGGRPAFNVDGASPRFGAARLLKLVTIRCGSGGGGSGDGWLGSLGLQPCDLFLQRRHLIAKLSLTVLRYYKFHLLSPM